MTRKDRLVPWYFVLFFAVIFAVNAVMMMFAIRTHTGIITDHPYEKGLAYNQVVNAETAQKSLGWKTAITYHQGILSVALNDAHGTPLKPDTLMSHITRPTQDGMDFDVTLTDGSAEVTFPARGIWDVRIFASIKGRHYQSAQRIVVP